VDHARHPAELQEKLEKIGKLHEVGDSLVTIHDLPEDEEEREKKPE